MQTPRRFYVYILTNPSQHPLYTGVTNNLDRRIAEHRDQVNDGYTSRYNLNRLVYYEVFRDVRAAIAREKEIKGWGRAKKIALENSLNPEWNDLALEWGKPAPLLTPSADRTKT
jgi:putative endonuclease